MHKPLYLSLFPILAVLTLVASSPTIRSSLQRRQGVNCTDPDAIASGSCWDTLHLADYLTDWNKNRPICKTTDGTLEDGAHCCAPNEVWSTCFIRLKLGNHGYNCININQGTCPNFDVDGNTAPEVRYILGTMYSINNFFSNWNGALPYATLSALLINQPLILEIDPVQKTHFFLKDLLTALTAGLSFIAGPEIGGIAGTAADVLVTGLQAAPGVAQAIWPTDTEDSQSDQLANLDSYLLQIDQNFTTRITNALYKIMSDVPSFNGFASSGHFSGPNNLSLPTDSELLALGLRTFIMTTAMSNNGWSYTVLYDQTMADIASPVSGFDCTFDAKNICADSQNASIIYYSNSTAHAFAFSHAGPTSTSRRDLLDQIVDKKWTNLELLFDGAYNCSTAPGGSGIGQPLKFFNGTALNFACMSQLPGGPVTWE